MWGGGDGVSNCHLDSLKILREKMQWWAGGGGGET